MAMNPRLLRPTSSSFHPEALDWRTRVVANGGSVSASTMRAVSAFCAEINAKGLRSRMYRVNLFCGNNLAACLVPLYNSLTPGGTVLGFATDTNASAGPFGSGDFNESIGLTPGGSAGSQPKHLDTGLAPDDFPSGSGVGHASVFKGAGSVGASTLSFIGSRTALAFWYTRANASTDLLAGNFGYGNFSASASADTTAGLVLHTRDAGGYVLYKNTTSVATDAARTPGANANAFTVFNHRAADGSVASSTGWIHVISSYSIGDSLTSGQVTDFYNALVAFNTAMGR